jgi:uncharacterized repeat protein (TIGR03803 family)
LGALTLSGTTLYGTSPLGGSDGGGTIFQINTDGSGYQVLYQFATIGSTGSMPNGSPILSGSTLYGMNSVNGTYAAGTVFSFSLIGQTFTTNVSSAGNGTITSSASTVAYGGSVTFTINPSPGYHLSSLTDNGVNVTAAAQWNGAYYTYTLAGVTGDNTVDATFAPGAPSSPAAVPALSTPLVALSMLGLAGILWRVRSNG